MNEKGLLGHIQAVWLAKIINAQSGGTVIAPWEIDQLPEEWLDLLLGIGTDLQQMKEAQDRVDAWFKKTRREHPTYSKLVM